MHAIKHSREKKRKIIKQQTNQNYRKEKKERLPATSRRLHTLLNDYHEIYGYQQAYFDLYAACSFKKQVCQVAVR